MQQTAVHSKLATYVDTAIACLKAWARANGQNWEALTDPDALLLQTLLTKSKAEVKRGVAPILPLIEFKGLLKEGLTARRWEQFLRWFSREISNALAKTCQERAEQMLYPARSSNGSGGRGPGGQAVYFLSFQEPPKLHKARRAESAVPGAAEKEDELPKPKAPPRHAKGGESSPNAKEPSTEEEIGNLGAEPDSRERESRSKQQRQPDDQDLPLGVFLNLPSADRRSSSEGWLVAMALALVLVTFAGPASTSLVDDLIRALSSIREALSGDVIVRL